MTQGNILLLGLPLLVGGVIAAFNANGVNDTTEKTEAWVRKRQRKTSASRSWFSSYIVNPILWIIVKFCDWTDSFAHRGLKSGTRVAATLYLITAWCFVLYMAFMVALALAIVGGIIYVAFKLFFNSNDDGYEERIHESGSNFKMFGGNTINCRACGSKVSTDAEECLSCGEYLKGYKMFGGSIKECRACGSKVSTDAEVCPSCGEHLKGYKMFGGSTKECRACGSKVSTDAEECPNCGEHLKGYKMFGGSTKDCRACGSKVSTDAEECPNCGEYF